MAWCKKQKLMHCAGLAVLNATLAEKNTSTSLSTADLEMADVKHKLADALSTLKGGAKSLHMPGKEYQQLLFRAVSLMVASPRVCSLWTPPC